MAETDKIDLWKERVKITQEFQKKNGAEDWKRYVELYNNKQWPSEVKEEDRVTVNYIYAVVVTAKPMLYFKNPYILVIPRREKFRAGAETAERALNYEWGEYRLKEKIKMATLDALIMGHGWLKQYYEDDKILTERISPFDMFIDPETRNNWRKARYLIHRTYKPLDEVKKNPNYKNLRDLKATKRISEVLTGQRAEHREKLSDDVERVELWEIHDKENGKLRVIASGHDKWLRNEDHPYKCEDYIFEMLRFIEVPDKFYPMSSVAPIESPCKELNKTRTQLINHRKRHKRIYIYNSNMLKPSDMENIEKSETLSFIPTEVEDLSRVIYPVPDVSLGADIYMIEKIIKEDITRLYGQSEYARAGAEPGAETATEAMLIERGQRLRPDEMMDIVQDFCSDIARKRLQIMKQYYRKKHMYRFTDELGGAQWGEFTKEDIQGEYDVQIEAASTLPWSEEVRRKYAMDALNLLANPGLQLQLQREGFEIKISKLVKGVLKDLKMRDTSDVLVPYIPQKSPTPLLPEQVQGRPMNVQKLQEKVAPNEAEEMRRQISRSGGVMGGGAVPGVGGGK